MKATNGKIIVRVDKAQKNTMTIGGIQVSLALKYETNNREKAPVIAEVISDGECVRQGDFILCHHNHFSGKQYHLQNDLYSIPANHTIFAILQPSGELSPVYGNVLAAKVEIETPLPVPPEQREHYKDRGLILNGGWTEFKPGDLVFTRPSAIYEIVFIFGEVERRVCKINSEMICAVIEKPVERTTGQGTIKTINHEEF
jgi:co-chaperonin GroES (HSP10)